MEERPANDGFLPDGTLAGAVPDRPVTVPAPAPAPYGTDRSRAEERAVSSLSAEALADPSTNTAAVPADVLALVFPGFSDGAKHEKALALFVDGSTPMADIADAVGVPLRTVAKWAAMGNWAALPEATLRVVRRQEKARLDLFRAKEREATMTGQVRDARAMRKIAIDMAREAQTPGQAMTAAAALKSASDVETKALGIDDSGAIDGESKDDSRKEGKTSFTINFGGALPEIRPAAGKARGKEVIDVG